ncbi:HNH endonuclease [Aeromonas dhakensis]|uniref:HNH endonuclease n=1 Tax=Aeromonas dhakensis TaxID=196024 RepID=UPI003B9F33C0
MNKIELSSKYDKLKVNCEQDVAKWNETSDEITSLKKEIRDFYLNEQKRKCAYCRQEKLENHGMTWDIEHILPKSIYPQFILEPENLAVACKECNQAKSNKDPLSVQNKQQTILRYPQKNTQYQIIHPHFDVYSQHIKIHRIGMQVIFIPIAGSPKGVFTFNTCNLLRFSYAYSGYGDTLDSGIKDVMFGFLDRCPPGTSKEKLKEMSGFMSTELSNLDF